MAIPVNQLISSLCSTTTRGLSTKPEPEFLNSLRSPRINSKEPISPDCEAWQAGTATLTNPIPSPHRLQKVSCDGEIIRKVHVRGGTVYSTVCRLGRDILVSLLYRNIQRPVSRFIGSPSSFHLPPPPPSLYLSSIHVSLIFTHNWHPFSNSSPFFWSGMAQTIEK